MTTWPRVSLGKICELKYGKGLAEKNRRPGPYRVFGSNGVVGTHLAALTTGPAIIVGRKGSLGEVHYSDGLCWPIDTTYYIDQSSALCDLKWLYYRLRDLGLKDLNRAAAVPGLNREDAYEKELLLPPLASQKRIAEALERVDQLRALRRHSITLLDNLTQSFFQALFEDGILGQQWPSLPLGRTVRAGTIVTYGIVQAGDEYPNGVPYIRTGDMRNGWILSEQLRRTSPEIASRFARSRVEIGDIVMSIRATVGTTASVTAQCDGANLTQGTARISPGELTDPLYLLHFLRSKRAQDWIEGQVKGATFREITLGRLRELAVHLPPLSLQREFARRVVTVDRMRSVYFAHLAELDVLFGSLQYRAFCGELFDSVAV